MRVCQEFMCECVCKYAYIYLFVHIYVCLFISTHIAMDHFQIFPLKSGKLQKQASLKLLALFVLSDILISMLSCFDKSGEKEKKVL